MMVVFEGPDASGKDAIHEEFERLTGFLHSTVVRFFLSKWVYSRYFDRGDSRYYRELIRESQLFQNAFDAVTVYCDADDPTLVGRIESRGESVTEVPNIQEIRNLYEAGILSLVPSDRLIRIDTSGSPDPAAKAAEVIRALEKIEKARR